jgi:hypothetical protein
MALQAMDKLQDTLGGLLKLKGKLSVSKTVCGLGAFDALNSWEPNASGSKGGLSGRPPGAKSPDAYVPETRDLTMKQMVEATICAQCNRSAGGLGRGISSSSSHSQCLSESSVRYQ